MLATTGVGFTLIHPLLPPTSNRNNTMNNMSSSTQLLLHRRVARGSFLPALSIFFFPPLFRPLTRAAEKRHKGINRRAEQGDKAPHNFQPAHFRVTNALRLRPDQDSPPLPGAAARPSARNAPDCVAGVLLFPGLSRVKASTSRA